VLAADPLRAPLTEIVDDFEVANPGLRVLLVTGSSEAVTGSLRQGTEADVVVVPSIWLDALEQRPGISGRADVATDPLVVVTPAFADPTIARLDDLAGEGVRLALVQLGTPVGDASVELLRKAGIAARVQPHVAATQADVMGVLQKVALGEVDAGIVNRSAASGPVATDLRMLEISPSLRDGEIYGAAIGVNGAANPFAAPFVTYLRGAGRDALRDAGFLPP